MNIAEEETMLKLQADRGIFYRGLTLPEVYKKTDNNVILLPGVNLHLYTLLSEEN